MSRWLLIAVLTSTAGAQHYVSLDTPPVEYAFTQPCDVVRPAALLYFQKQELPLIAAPSCAGCLIGSTKHLHDESGRRVFGTRNVITRYTTKDLSLNKAGPLSGFAYSGVNTTANMRLQPQGDGCHMILHFLYGWYGSYLVLGFPVDGDRDGGWSNGKLETAYLQALKKQLDSDAGGQTVSIH